MFPCDTLSWSTELLNTCTNNSSVEYFHKILKGVLKKFEKQSKCVYLNEVLVDNVLISEIKYLCSHAFRKELSPCGKILKIDVVVDGLLTSVKLKGCKNLIGCG